MSATNSTQAGVRLVDPDSLLRPACTSEAVLPTEQTVIVITAAGGPEVLQPRRTAVPTPAEGELLIAVHAAGVNRHDVGQRRRGPSKAHSDVPGLEVAGIVVEVGCKVRDWSVGDRVCALTDGGGYAEYAVAPAAHAFRVSEKISFMDAAALPEALFTLWHNFFNVAALRAGESVLLHGGTSGVGTLAIQCLTRLGHPVFVTCGSGDKAAVALRLGAVKAFNYRTERFEEGIGLHTEGRGVDVILDMSGGRYSARNVDALAMRGRIVHLSPGDGADFQAPLRAIMAKEAKISGSLLRPLPAEEKTLIAKRLRSVLLPRIEAGEIAPLVRKVVPLRDAALAHQIIEEPVHFGKLVLHCTAPA